MLAWYDACVCAGTHTDIYTQNAFIHEAGNFLAFHIFTVNREEAANDICYEHFSYLHFQSTLLDVVISFIVALVVRFKKVGYRLRDFVP
jgi:hypothetical protein